MKTIDLNLLSKEVHFPEIQPIVNYPPKSMWLRILSFFMFRREYKIIKDYFMWSNLLKKFIFIPKQFIYDGASVPKFLGMFYNATGVLFYGAGPHDFGYRYKSLILVDEFSGEIEICSFTKKELDVIFNDLCFYESGMKIASGVATLGLSLFGFLGWNENRKRNALLKQDCPHLFEDIINQEQINQGEER